ncbi:hypothetical protein OUZ56_010379 [Daphnia magna]|uniref:Uncharacterized protein n=1 Tax=Daphnia magna TaxID=35525 RepID=A0ABR0AIG0_9CRUS|nr:hypothetical protein OUZ56_010379 [Daphnia magna]
MSDTDIHLTTLVNAAQNSELDLSPSKAYTKAEMVDNLALIATLQGSNMALATYAAPRQNQMTQRFQVIGGQQQNHAALQAIVAAPPNAPVIHPSTVAIKSTGSAGLEDWTADNCLGRHNIPQRHFISMTRANREESWYLATLVRSSCYNLFPHLVVSGIISY